MDCVRITKANGDIVKNSNYIITQNEGNIEINRRQLTSDIIWLKKDSYVYETGVKRIPEAVAEDWYDPDKTQNIIDLDKDVSLSGDTEMTEASPNVYTIKASGKDTGNYIGEVNLP